MSWFSTNYEKALLGGAVAIALGCAYMGWSKLNTVQDAFGDTLAGPSKDSSAVAGADLIPKALQSMKINRALQPSLDGERPVDLFTGVALFIKRDAPQVAIDLLKGEPVHEGIPNSFWLKNGIDPGFADSPLRDPDKDGFSNSEEFQAQTDPNDFQSHPTLIAKLRYVKDDSLVWVLRPGLAGTDGDFPMTYEDGKARKNAAPIANMIAAGEMFFENEPMKGRFKLLGSVVRREMNQATNTEVDVTIVQIEDQKPNKKGRVYEFPSPMSKKRINDYLQYDRSAVMTLEAMGQEGKEFTVEENTQFSLGNRTLSYLLKEVTPDAIVVEYVDSTGAQKNLKIDKGSK